MSRSRVAFLFLLLIPLLLRSRSQSAKQVIEGGTRPINGTKLYCRVMGSGPSVVFVHGGPGMDHAYLLPQMAELAKHYKLIFYDQRASGKSASIVDTNTITMDMFVEDLEGIRIAFKLGKMNLVGHSWGGLVAMFYAVRYPQNLNSMILTNSTPASAALRKVSFEQMARRTSKEDSIAQAAIAQTSGFKSGNPETMSRFFRILFRRAFFDKRYTDSVTLTLDTSFATKSRMIQYLSRDRELENYDLFPRLRTIRCATLIIGGDSDTVPEEANEKIHAYIRGSSYVLIKCCGHFPFIESPKEFFETVEGFLGKVTK